jgi:hypothetical protein
MKNCNAPEHQTTTTRRTLPIACATALAVAFTVSLPQAVHAQVAPPPVPAGIEVPPGNEVFLVGHGVGTQNYICLPSGSGFAFTLFTPQATLFVGLKQITTHFFSTNNNPDDAADKGKILATWQHSRDTSTVWAAAISQSSDANFVAPGAIPWVKLKRAGVQDGPGGGDTLTATSFIQRLNTRGGSAPSGGCAALGDVGKKAFVPYTADYFFYTDHSDTVRR